MNDLALRDASSVSAFEMRPRTLDEAMKFAEIMANSDLVPAGYKGKPGNILVACQMGHELGMTPMRALRSIAVINGRATMWGDEMLAMVLASPRCEYVREQESTDKQGICRVKRKGDAEEHVSIFTLEDAKRAGLLGKQGPWQTSTKRMLTLRARGFALRDKFPDVLAGLVTTEEAIDLLPTDSPKSLTAEMPKTLKERLKKQLDHAATNGEAMSESPDQSGPSGLPPSGDAPSELPDPTVAWKARLRTCARNHKAISEAYHAIPEDLRADCYAEYTAQLKSLAKPS